MKPEPGRVRDGNLVLATAFVKVSFEERWILCFGSAYINRPFSERGASIQYGNKEHVHTGEELTFKGNLQ